MQYTYLTAHSVLFWLVGMIALGIIFIGARFILAPRPAARDFGVPAPDSDRFTFLWAKGTRDIVSGLLVIGLLWVKASLGIMAAFLLIASLIPFGDMLNVYVTARTRNLSALIIHGGTALFMCILAAVRLYG